MRASVTLLMSSRVAPSGITVTPGFRSKPAFTDRLVIDPLEPEPFSYDRDYVVMLSDWSDEDPTDIYAKLKKMSGYYNFAERTAGDLARDIEKKGVARTWSDRARCGTRCG